MHYVMHYMMHNLMHYVRFRLAFVNKIYIHGSMSLGRTETICNAL